MDGPASHCSDLVRNGSVDWVHGDGLSVHVHMVEGTHKRSQKVSLPANVGTSPLEYWNFEFVNNNNLNFQFSSGFLL